MVATLVIRGIYCIVVCQIAKIIGLTLVDLISIVQRLPVDLALRSRLPVLLEPEPLSLSIVRLNAHSSVRFVSCPGLVRRHLIAEVHVVVARNGVNRSSHKGAIGRLQAI